MTTLWGIELRMALRILGVIVVLVVLAAAVNTGKKLERLKADNAKCSQSLKTALQNARGLEASLQAQSAAAEEAASAAAQAERLYRELLNRPTTVRPATPVTIINEIPSGDCDRSAVAAYELLVRSNFIKERNAWSDYESQRLQAYFSGLRERGASPPPVVLPNTHVWNSYALYPTGWPYPPPSQGLIGYPTWSSSPQD